METTITKGISFAEFLHSFEEARITVAPPVANCGQEAADAIGQEHAVRIAEVVAEVHIGEAEYSEYYQSSDQGDNQQVLNLGSQGQRRRRPGR